MLPMIPCEWNIDLASDNLGACATRDEARPSTELTEHEMSYCKYEGELTYMYQPDALDSLPPTMCALYGSDGDAALQANVVEAYPIIMPDESHTETQIKEEEWSDQQPTSPSHDSVDSVDSSWESQVSTPQASPRRCQDDSAPTTTCVKSTRAKPEKSALKDRKRDLKEAKETRQAEIRVKSRANTTKLSAYDDAEDDDEDDFVTRPSNRNRSVTPLPEDDPEGLFTRDPSTLSPEELRMLKKKKRLIKNRESAQLSRQRKRIRLETLQGEVQHLEDENKALTARVEALLEENAALKRKLTGPGKTRASAAAVH